METLKNETHVGTPITFFYNTMRVTKPHNTNI